MNEITTYNAKEAQSIIPAQKASALNVMAARYSVEPTKLLDTLKQTVFKNATDAQLMALVVVANEYGLNPFTKQIHAFPDKGGGIVPVIGVDGWMKMMNDHPRFDGIEVDVVEDASTGKPFSVTATIHVKDRKFPTKITEHLSECARNTDPWNKQPRRMLRHRAIIQAIRVAFGFSAMDPDEAEAISSATPVASKPDFSVSVEPAKESPEVPVKRLGRPPKTAAMPPAVIELAKDPEPATTPAEQNTSFVRGLRGLMKLSGIEEGDFLAHMREKHGMDESLSSLEEIQLTSPSVLEKAYAGWATIEKAVKEAK